MDEKLTSNDKIRELISNIKSIIRKKKKYKSEIESELLDIKKTLTNIALELQSYNKT